MTIPLATPGGLFTRLGHVFGGLLDVNALRGAPALDSPSIGPSGPMPIRFAVLDADYRATPPNDAVLDGNYVQLGAYQAAQSSFLGYLQTLAINTAIEMANQDQALPQKTLPAALQLLIAQMIDDGESVKASTPAIAEAAPIGAPNGTPIIVASVKAANGLLLENAFAEVLTLTVTGDSQGSATLGQEPLLIRGAAAVNDALSYLWPGGSGCALNFNAIDASGNNAKGNKLTNSDFEDFTTPNHADNWLRLLGTIGTTIFNGTVGNAYDGAGSLAFAGDAGGTLSAMAQPFNTAASTLADAGGTPAKLLPLTQYAYSFWAKCSAIPAAGALEASLTDQADATIADQAGTPNLDNHSLTALGAVWQKFKGTFRTPAVLPAGQRFKLRLGVAIDNGKTVYVDRLAFAPMATTYPGGPALAVFSGAGKLILGDAWLLDVTNLPGLIQQMCDRVYGMKALGLQLPSDDAGGETIPDSLVS